MLRKIIRINQDKCTGCGLCVDACHEGALGIVHGKARLLRESYCDGLGACLPECPADALSLEEVDAPEFDEAAVKAAANHKIAKFPIQLKLVSSNAPHLRDCDLLIAADCCAYVEPDFSKKYSDGKTVIIGCPKLDGADYSDKISEILVNNQINSITLTKMSVPCCGGILRMLEKAIEKSGYEKTPEIVTIDVR
jgi:NAD-dependent dihydropyrimidine dehydrogenase PreA subunit